MHLYLLIAFQNTVRNVRREEVARGWNRLHNEELPNLQVSPNMIRVIKVRRTRWEEHVTRIGEMRNVYVTFWSENLKGRGHSGDLDVGGRIILVWIFGNRLRRCGLDSHGSG
jgi:hypothetical protein